MEISKKLFVQFWYTRGDPAFIIGVNGSATIDALEAIEAEMDDGGDPDPDIFSRGDGVYLFSAYYESPQYGFEGRVELEGYWGLDFVSYEPLELPK